MKHQTMNSIFKGVAISVFWIFILDTILHFLIVPVNDLTISLISFKGDIDFTNIGIINILVRFMIYGWLAFFPRSFSKWLPLSLLVIILPTIYLMVDSLWVFENYILLYGYWFAVLLTCLWIGFQFNQPSKPTWMGTLIVSGLLILFIGLVYVDIMGWAWPREFIYAFFQRAIYEPIFMGLVLTAGYLRASTSNG